MAHLAFSDSLWHDIDIALRHLENMYNQEIKTLGLTIIEWYMLQMLYEEDGQIVSRLAERVGRPTSLLTHTLDGLQRKGLIERRRHPVDRRAVNVHLIAEGQALKEGIRASIERIETKTRQAFSNEDWQNYESVIADLQAIAYRSDGQPKETRNRRKRDTWRPRKP